jgi:ferric-dicitrate binding protein FerR (iron transport regulator)
MMNGNKVWEEVAASLNQEPFDQETIEGAEAWLKEARDADLLLKQKKKTIQFLLNADSTKAWERFNRRAGNKLPLLRKIMLYAACITLLIAAGYLLGNRSVLLRPEKESWLVFSVPNAEMGNVVLPDGTNVYLNSATELRYNTAASQQREVSVNGEAFFEVRSDEKHPFLVRLNDFTVKVTGTSFNLRSYPDNDTEATLIEGKIIILNKKGSEIVRMKPGESILYDRPTGKFMLRNVDPKMQTEWLEGKIYLKNKTMEEIAATLERWYDVKFEFEDQSLKQIRLTGTILKNKPVEQILEILKISEPVDFEYSYENQMISTIKIRRMQNIKAVTD